MINSHDQYIEFIHRHSVCDVELLKPNVNPTFDLLWEVSGSS